MNNRSRTAFTLVELLVVIVIVGVLVALLIPGAASAWDTALTALCKMNLNRMWQAQNAWRGERGYSTFTTEGTWPSLLEPYLEGGGAVLRCPASSVDRTATGGSSGGGAGGSGGGSTSKGITLSDITFRMYARVDFAPYKPGQYLGTAFVDSSYGVQKKDLGGGRWYYGVDDRSFFLDKSADKSNLDYADMRFNLTMEGEKITKMEILGSDEITGQRSHEVFRFEIWISDQLLSQDFVAATGTTFDMPKIACVTAFDYGLSRGTYEVLGVRAEQADPKLILILDYGKSVADYASPRPDPWDEYFFTDEAAWMDKFGGYLQDGEDWRNYQALRHFGAANVLFCDGHVELLGPEDLYETCPLWRFTGH